MSEALRTAAEYVELYARKHHKSIEEALKDVEVRLFKEYQEQRDDELYIEADNSIKSQDRAKKK